MKMWLTFLYPLIGLAGGILLFEEFHLHFLLSFIFIGFALLIWLYIHKQSEDPFKSMVLNSYHYFWIIPLFIGIGVLDAKFNESNFHIKESDEGNILTVIGTVYDSQSSVTGDKLLIKIDSVATDNGSFSVNNARMIVYTDGVTATKGDIVKFCSKIFSFQNSDDWNPDYAKRMKRNGIDFYARVRENNIKVIGQSDEFRYKISDLRDKCIILLDKSSLSKNSGNFLISILLGDKTFLQPEIKETITQAGIAHILALSGMHVAIIFSLTLFLLFPLALSGHSRVRKVVAIVIIWCYVLFTGCWLSTVRAALMISFVVWAFLLERKHSPINSLFAAAFFILLFDPLALWDTGFQLSFICVASIILFVEKFNPIQRHQHPKTYNIVNLCLISLIVTLATSTLTLYYFGSIPLLFLPSNLILVPLLPLFVGAGIFYLILLIIGVDFTLLSKLIDSFYNVFIDSALVFSARGESQFSLPINETSVFLWLLAFIFLAVGLYASRRKLIYKSVAVSFFCLSILSIVLYQEQDQKSLTFHHSFTAMNVTLKNSRENNRFIFPRQSFSRNENEEYVIIAVDCPLKEEFIDKITYQDDNRKKFLLIGPDADDDQMAYLIANGNYHKVILHATIGNRHKENLLGLINETLYHKIHSLRDEGSIEIHL